VCVALLVFLFSILYNLYLFRVHNSSLSLSLNCHICLFCVDYITLIFHFLILHILFKFWKTTFLIVLHNFTCFILFLCREFVLVISLFCTCFITSLRTIILSTCQHSCTLLPQPCIPWPCYVSSCHNSTCILFNLYVCDFSHFYYSFLQYLCIFVSIKSCSLSSLSPPLFTYDQRFYRQTHVFSLRHSIVFPS
jgi:hypothetical protein